MREPKPFAQRTKILTSDNVGKKEVGKKYFLVYEGAKTEKIYFEGVEANRQKLGINPLIELIPLIRSYGEENWSNPKKILDCVMQELHESKTGQISCETLKNRVMDYFQDEGIFSGSKMSKGIMWQTLDGFCTQKFGKDKSNIIHDLETTCDEMVRYLKKEASLEKVMDNVFDIIKNPAISYGEGVCILSS